MLIPAYIILLLQRNLGFHINARIHILKLRSGGAKILVLGAKNEYKEHIIFVFGKKKKNRKNLSFMYQAN